MSLLLYKEEEGGGGGEQQSIRVLWLDRQASYFQTSKLEYVFPFSAVCFPNLKKVPKMFMYVFIQQTQNELPVSKRRPNSSKLNNHKDNFFPCLLTTSGKPQANEASKAAPRVWELGWALLPRDLRTLEVKATQISIRARIPKCQTSPIDSRLR